MLDVVFTGPSLSTVEDSQTQTQTERYTVEEEVGKWVAYLWPFLCMLDSLFDVIVMIGETSDLKLELHESGQIFVTSF